MSPCGYLRSVSRLGETCRHRWLFVSFFQLFHIDGVGDGKTGLAHARFMIYFEGKKGNKSQANKVPVSTN